MNLISSCTLDVIEEKEEAPVAIPAAQPVVKRTTPTVVTPKEPVYARCSGP